MNYFEASLSNPLSVRIYFILVGLVDFGMTALCCLNLLMDWFLVGDLAASSKPSSFWNVSL